MIRTIPSAWFRTAALAVVLLACAGCAYRVVRPRPLVVWTPETGVVRTVKYPTYVLVHDSESFWDAHQIKDNLMGLAEGEIVHWLDLGFDAIVPGSDVRPLQSGVEWIKNEYAKLPDCAPVRIVGGLFSALAIEKTTVVYGANAFTAPASPTSHFFFMRVIYLTDWVQNTLGEINAGAGHLVPWPVRFIPLAVTTPANEGVDWAQSGAVSVYIRVVHRVNVALDDAITGVEDAWGGVVWWFVRD